MFRLIIKVLYGLRTAFHRFDVYLFWLIDRTRNAIKNGKNERVKTIDTPVLVIGNGPSAGILDYEHYINEGYSCLCVNYYALNEEMLNRIKPRYYCIIDPEFYDEPRPDRAKKLFEILNCVDWDMSVITLSNQKASFSNPHIDVIRLNTNYCEFRDSIKWFKRYKRNTAVCGYQNVITAALFYLICADCPSVLLTGVESDMHRELRVDITNDVYRDCEHFYGKETLNVTKNGQIGKGQLYRYFYFYYVTLQQYHIMSRFASIYGVRVKNICTKSFIDVFEKEEPVNSKIPLPIKETI